MDVLKDIKHVPDALRGGAIAIGNFDGVHRGHQAVLDVAKNAADKNGGIAGVMAFDPHPREFFQPSKPIFRLSQPERKLELFEAYGIDLAVILNFNKALSSLTAEDFVSKILVDGLGVSHVVTGYNFFFGHKRGGNPDLMRKLGEKHGFGVDIVEAQGQAGDLFSSSRIRELLQEGDPRGAADMLGYWWRVRGVVTGGQRIGTWLGFPTANIAIEQAQEFRHGIYAVRVYLGDERFDGAAYLGTRPTFDDGPPVLETFLFDFDEKIYGKTIEVELVDFVREDARFETPEALKEQMMKDCERARQILINIGENDPMDVYPLGA